MFIVTLATYPIPFTNGKTVIAQIYWQGLYIVPIVLLSYLFNGWYTNFIVGIYIQKKTKTLPIITAVAASTEAILCFLFIPIFSIIGGAYATLGGYIVMSLGVYFYIQKHYFIEYEWRRILYNYIIVLTLWLTNYFLFDLMDISYKSLITKLILVLLYPICLFIFRFFHENEMKEIKIIFNRFKNN